MQRPAVLPLIDPADLAVTPVTRSDTIPSAWYTDPAFHAVDRDAVFARSWQNVGSVDQVREPGQFLVATVADNPPPSASPASLSSAPWWRGKDSNLRRREVGRFTVCCH